MSVHTAIADAVVAVLNAAPLSLDAERRYVIEDKLPDLATRRVSVALGAVTVNPQDRDAQSFLYDVDTIIEKKTASVAPESVDPVMDLAETVLDRFRGRTLDGYPSAKWMEAQVIPSLDKLVDYSVASVTVRNTYRVSRAVVS